MNCQRVQYKWKIIAWNALKKKMRQILRKKRKKKETLNERRSKKKKACMKDFKEVTRNSYDFADRWGTDEVLL